MPSAYVKKIAAKKNISIDRAETLWSKAKTLAADQGHAEEFDYITGIFKRMVGEQVTYIEFMKIFEEGEPTNTSSNTAPDRDHVGKKKILKRKKKKECKK